ncbi:hypothetical protein EHS25_009160 [Saitozyma podzolica]|uniref:Uncharacterized protein n=1 Tax=Saitozyma podzolica TaxID=1890683 RepID=A0A427YL41_9TREE|nr:hypothetical protein EHS25_009160 [Saitozyma podzolica]
MVTLNDFVHQILATSREKVDSSLSGPRGRTAGFGLRGLIVVCIRAHRYSAKEVVVMAKDHGWHPRLLRRERREDAQRSIIFLTGTLARPLLPSRGAPTLPRSNRSPGGVVTGSALRSSSWGDPTLLF